MAEMKEMIETIKLDIVTLERVIFSANANMVIAPGIEGYLGILPHHAPLMTLLQPGELIVRRNGEDEICIAIGGGFLEVRPDRIIVLADVAERAEEIDIARAEEAERRAEQALSQEMKTADDKTQAEAALRSALAQLKVVEKRRKTRKF